MGEIGLQDGVDDDKVQKEFQKPLTNSSPGYYLIAGATPDRINIEP